MRLIDADVAQRIADEELTVSDAGTVQFVLSHTPTIDAVPVVRCKDCKHFTEGMAVGMCKRIPDRPIIPMMYDDFCSRGERRDSDG